MAFLLYQFCHSGCAVLTGIKFVDLRTWGGNVLINKLASSLEPRQVHVSKSYVSPEGCTGICNN
jgi:hypothetical protein